LRPRHPIHLEPAPVAFQSVKLGNYRRAKVRELLRGLIVKAALNADKRRHAVPALNQLLVIGSP